MSKIITFSTQIYPTKNQIKYFRKAFGVRRYLWNWGLEISINMMNAGGKRPSGFDLAKICNHTILEDGNHEWIKEVSPSIRINVFKELDQTYKVYFDCLKKMRTNTKINKVWGQPKYQSKKKSTNSFTNHRSNEKTFMPKHISNNHFKLPTIQGKRNLDTRLNLKLAENINFLKSNDINIKLVTIKEFPINIFTIFITYERVNHKVEKPNEDSKIGIDVGMKTPLTCWDGENSYKLNPLDRIKKAERKREKYNKKLSKKLNLYKKQQKKKAFNKGFKFRESKRYLKIKQKLQKSYQREENIKKDFREKTTTWLVQNYHVINIEPFNDGFKKSRRAVARISQYAFYERLKEKSKLYDTQLNWISWEPTTQTCSSCRHRFIDNEKLLLKDRKYICPVCGMIEDRDINAAKNIYNLK